MNAYSTPSAPLHYISLCSSPFEEGQFFLASFIAALNYQIVNKATHFQGLPPLGGLEGGHYDFLRLPECIVPGRDDAVARLQTIDDLVVERVLASHADGSACSACAVGIEAVYPAATRVGVEVTLGHEHGRHSR